MQQVSGKSKKQESKQGINKKEDNMQRIKEQAKKSKQQIKKANN